MRFSGTSSWCLQCFTYLKMEVGVNDKKCYILYGFGHSCIQIMSLDGPLVRPGTIFLQDKVQTVKIKACVEWARLVVSSLRDFETFLFRLDWQWRSMHLMLRDSISWSAFMSFELGRNSTGYLALWCQEVTLIKFLSVCLTLLFFVFRAHI